MSAFSMSRTAAMAAALALLSTSASLVAARPSTMTEGSLPEPQLPADTTAYFTQASLASNLALPEGMSFEPGLTREQQAQLWVMLPEIVEAHHQQEAGVGAVARRSTCAAKTACYVASCGIPFLGIACLLCDKIQCRRETTPNDVVVAGSMTFDSLTLPEGMSFEPGLTREQQAQLWVMLPEIVEAHHQQEEAGVHSTGVARRSTCAAKTACYIASCPIPFLGIGCLLCDKIQCRREATPNDVSVAGSVTIDSLALPEGMSFEPGLTREQQAKLWVMLPEIVEAVHHHKQEAGAATAANVDSGDAAVARRGTCAAKTACYIASCGIPIFGIACLACGGIC